MRPPGFRARKRHYLTPGLSNPGALELALLVSHRGDTECVRNSRLPGSIVLDVDARNLGAFDAETCHQSLLVEYEGVSIIF